MEYVLLSGDCRGSLCNLGQTPTFYLGSSTQMRRPPASLPCGELTGWLWSTNHLECPMLSCLRLVGKLVLKTVGNCTVYFQKQKKKKNCMQLGQKGTHARVWAGIKPFFCLILKPISFSVLVSVLFLAALLPKGSASHSPQGSPSKQPSELGCHRNPQIGLVTQAEASQSWALVANNHLGASCRHYHVP